MIREILLPEQINGYYLFEKKIAGVEITPTDVYVTYIDVSGKNITIQSYTQAAIERDNGQDELERTAQAVRQATNGHVDVEFHTAISSAHVIFKQLKMPFHDRQKIQKIIEFEVEPLLPFSVQDAIIDFMVTAYIPEDQSCTIMVAAVQKQYIEQQIAIFSHAGLQPTTITVDMFQLYALYKQSPTYMALKGGVALIDIGFQITKIAYIVHGELRYIRTLNNGIAQVSRQMAQELNLHQSEIVDSLMRFGFEKTDNASYTKALHTAYMNLVQQIQFSLQSFSAQSEAADVEQILLLGMGAMVDGTQTWIAEQIQRPTDLFTLEPGTAGSPLQTSEHIPLTHCISTATALPFEQTADINMRQKEFEQKNPTLFIQQLIVAATLFLSTFLLLFVHNYLQVRKLRTELNASKQEAQRALKNQFKDIPSGHLGSMIEEAQQKIAADEKLWSPFSAASRNSFLYYLLELTRLDKKSLELIVHKVTLDQDKRVMRLKAQVKDTDALTLLEQELRQSGLFSYVQSPDYPSFDMELRFADTHNKESK